MSGKESTLIDSENVHSQIDSRLFFEFFFTFSLESLTREYSIMFELHMEHGAWSIQRFCALFQTLNIVYIVHGSFEFIRCVVIGHYYSSVGFVCKAPNRIKIYEQSPIQCDYVAVLITEQLLLLFFCFCSLSLSLSHIFIACPCTCTDNVAQNIMSESIANISFHTRHNWWYPVDFMPENYVHPMNERTTMQARLFRHG